MTIVIIDQWPERREHITKWIEQADVAASVVPLEAAPATALPDADVVLLHAGDSQADLDDIGALIDHYGPRSWVVCYSGGELVPAALTSKWPSVACFPSRVGIDNPGLDFRRTLERVLGDAVRRSSLPEDALRRTVTGFDEGLEARLEVLSDCISKKTLSVGRLELLKDLAPRAFDKDGRLDVDCESYESVRRLRDLLFSE